MVLLLPLLLVAVVVYLWWTRRNSTLTRACRWRLDRSLGPQSWLCVACGACCDLPPGARPNDCLRGRGAPRPLPRPDAGPSGNAGSGPAP